MITSDFIHYDDLSINKDFGDPLINDLIRVCGDSPNISFEPINEGLFHSYTQLVIYSGGDQLSMPDFRDRFTCYESYVNGLIEHMSKDVTIDYYSLVNSFVNEVNTFDRYLKSFAVNDVGIPYHSYDLAAINCCRYYKIDLHTYLKLEVVADNIQSCLKSGLTRVKFYYKALNYDPKKIVNMKEIKQYFIDRINATYKERHNL